MLCILCQQTKNRASRTRQLFFIWPDGGRCPPYPAIVVLRKSGSTLLRCNICEPGVRVVLVVGRYAVRKRRAYEPVPLIIEGYRVASKTYSGRLVVEIVSV